MTNTKQIKPLTPPAQLAALWVNRAQKATTLQTTGVWHVRPTAINPN